MVNINCFKNHDYDDGIPAIWLRVVRQTGNKYYELHNKWKTEPNANEYIDANGKPGDKYYIQVKYDWRQQPSIGRDFTVKVH